MSSHGKKDQAKLKEKNTGRALQRKDDKLDYSRTVRADPRDPRTVGSPCFGSHEPAAPFRGSPTGENAHQVQVETGVHTCIAWGAHALTRQAGALPVDVERQLDSLKEKAPYSDLLRNHEIGLDGAERSCLDRLEKIRHRKNYNRSSPSTPSTRATDETTVRTASEGYRSPSQQMPLRPRTPVIDVEQGGPPTCRPTVVNLEEADHAMLPGRKERRSSLTPEELEAAERERNRSPSTPSWLDVEEAERKTP